MTCDDLVTVQGEQRCLECGCDPFEKSPDEDMKEFCLFLRSTMPWLQSRTIQESPLSDAKPSAVEESLAEVVRFLGYFCLNHPGNQELVRLGPPPSILVRLCNLPFW